MRNGIGHPLEHGLLDHRLASWLENAANSTHKPD
jgi:hypothetical protein